MFWTLWHLAHAGWVMQPGPWDAAPLRAADQQDDTLWVLSGAQVYRVDGETVQDLGALPPAGAALQENLGVRLEGPRAWQVSDTQICSAMPGDSAWACQSVGESFPRVPHFHDGVGVSGGLRGAAWIYRAGRWTPLSHSALPDSIGGHNRGLWADEEGLWLATRTDLIHVRQPGTPEQEIETRPLPEATIGAGALTVCSGNRVLGAGRAWDWGPQGWTPLDSPATQCGGGWLATSDGQIHGPEGPQASPAQSAPLWLGADWALSSTALLRHVPEQDIAFVDRAAQWGVAQQDPGMGALLADLMGSPAPDLLLVDSLGRPRLYENRGDRFVERPQAGLAEASWPGGLQACDLDGDGKQEISFTQVQGERATLEIWRVNPSGMLESWAQHGMLPAREIATTSGAQVSCLDLDLDGHQDLYLSFLQGPGGWPRPNLLVHNQGYGRMAWVDLDPMGLGGGDTWTTRVLYADLLAQGRPQLWIPGAWVGGTLWQHSPQGWRAVPKERAPLDPYQGWKATWAGDLDGDGDLDLLSSADEGLRLQEQRPEGWADRGRLGASRASRSSNARSMAVSDVDQDGDLDILGLGDGDRVVFYLNQGDWRFQSHGAAAGLQDLDKNTGAQLADVDLDGDLDLFLLGQGANRLYLNRGQGSGAAPARGERWTHRVARHAVWLPWPESLTRWSLLLAVLVLSGVRGRARRLPVSGRPWWLLGLALGAVELLILNQSPLARWVWGLLPAALLATSSVLETAIARSLRLQHIAHFRLEGAIGAGGMGMVYRAWDKKNARRVALKVLLPEIEAHPTVRQRFIREATLSLQIQHPHLVSATEHGPCTVWREGAPHSSHYLSMELMSGTLRSWMHGPTPTLRSVQILEQVLLGLQALHRREICHRDIKPENLLFDAQGCIKIADLGLALGPNSERLTRTSSLMGTLTYLAPELAQGGEASPQADLYAVGVLGYELLSGQPPVQGQESLELLYALLNTPPMPLLERCPELDPALCAVIQDCMAPTPEARPTDCAAVLAALAPFLTPEQGPLELETLPPGQALAHGRRDA